MQDSETQPRVLGMEEFTLPTREQVAAVVRRCGAASRRFLLGDVFAAFFATRLAFVLLTYFGVALLHDPALVGQTRTRVPGSPFDNWFFRDSQWYRSIVEHGYSYHGPGVQSRVAFFPVYPLAVKVLTTLTRIDVNIAAMIVANLAFLGALIYLRRLCTRDYGEAVARRAVFYMAIFPTAFFSFAGYSEPLFLLLSVASLYYMRSERWLPAGFLGGLAAGTRILGVLLIVPFAIEYIRACHANPRQLRLSALSSLLIPAGLAAYMLYLYSLTGTPFAFLRAEAGWGRATRWPWQTLLTSLSDVPHAGSFHPYFQAHAILETGLTLACLVVLLIGIRGMPLSYSMYGLACLVMLLSSPVTTSMIPLTAMSRFIFVLVPLYIVLARLGRWPIFDRAYVVLSTGCLALLSVLFINHMWGA